ncbi:hypothetical protein F5Y18DRAFT_26687 [Xylariaceae sp. FL1019]|nr:hypothetical protein F5Y18DRAFT_26687 [Xylariaceae sp. FL1019]
MEYTVGTGDDAKKVKFTPREVELIGKAFMCCKDPQINWQRFTNDAGYKNVGAARASFGPTMKKLKELHNEDAVVASGSPASKIASTKGRKRKLEETEADVEDESDGDNDDAAPVAKAQPRKMAVAKGRKAKATKVTKKVQEAVKQQESDDSVDSVEDPNDPITQVQKQLLDEMKAEHVRYPTWDELINYGDNNDDGHV